MRIFLLSGPVKGEVYSLSQKELHYLKDVLRIKENTVFTARDKNNLYYKALLIGDTLTLEETDDAEETLLDSLSGYDEEIFPLYVYQCLCKGKKNESIMRMLTEAGCREINFVRSRYTQIKELSVHDKERLEAARREAIQQSGSKTLCPEIEVLSLEEVVKRAPKPLLFLHQSRREKTLSLKAIFSAFSPAPSSFSLLIGSEGGFSAEECDFLEENGAVCVLLPTNVLRAETAGIFTAGAILTENS